MSGVALPADRSLAYFLLRLAFGVNLAAHGANRLLGGVAHFAQKTVQDFASVPLLPSPLVTLFAHGLPFVELTLGVLMLVGAQLRAVYAIGALVMATLTLGSALHADWSVVGIQLLFSLTYYLLLSRREDDVWGWDARGRWTKARATETPEQAGSGGLQPPAHPPR